LLDQWRACREAEFDAAVDFVSRRGESDVLAGGVHIAPAAADGVGVLRGGETGCIVDEIDSAGGVLCGNDGAQADAGAFGIGGCGARLAARFGG